MQCINEKFTALCLKKLTKLSIDSKFKPPVDATIGLFKLDASSKRGQSFAEQEAIFKISVSDSEAHLTESSSNGVTINLNFS